MIHSQNTQDPTEASALLTVIVTADGDGKGLSELLSDYRPVLDARPEPYELIVVYEQASAGLTQGLTDLKENWPNLKPIAQRPWAGEDAAIKRGIGQAVGDVVLTLPSWHEIEPTSVNVLLDGLDDADMVVGSRNNRARSGIQKFRSWATHGLLRALFQQSFNDVFCRARAGRRDVFLKVSELGVRQHFLPLIAASEGYKIKEVEVEVMQNLNEQDIYKFKPQAHVGALVDLLTLFVGLKYLRRPLRFFGSIGVPLILVGTLLTAYLVIERLVFGASLADRPALVFAVLMLVLGIQIVALGLVGEIIIFSSSRRLRSYEIDQVLRGRPTEAESTASAFSDASNEAQDPPDKDRNQANARSGIADA